MFQLNLRIISAIFNMQMPSSFSLQEEWKIFKLLNILFLFKVSSRLTINFSKSCLHSTNYGFRPNATSVAILNCNTDFLSLTYLRVPLSGKCPSRFKLILMVQARLTSWKANYLSLGGRLTLLNFVLTSIPMCSMSVFQLLIWVIKEIDKV